MNFKSLISNLFLLAFLTGCHPTTPPPNTSFPTRHIATPLARSGDEIIVCGQYFHTGAPVVLWTDPGGYDAYRTERRFAPWAVASFEASAKEAAENKRLKRDGTEVDSPNRDGVRFAPSTRPAATQAATEPATRYTSRSGRRPGRPTEGGTKLTPEEFEKV